MVKPPVVVWMEVPRLVSLGMTSAVAELRPTIASPRLSAERSHLSPAEAAPRANLPHSSAESPVLNPRNAQHSVFMSYCWTNSADALSQGQLGARTANTGPLDPRILARHLSQNGAVCWLDVDRRSGEQSRLHTLVNTILVSKFAILCISKEFFASVACQQQFEYILTNAKIPAVIVIVGSKKCDWESTKFKFMARNTPTLLLKPLC
ncbi:hypothetical protein BC830DRAFT_1175152 [Chytriomyces sp. MP71]|nr:hypothetical protein BC830DRAFT_1175152 [Chytriomyces sp. MP71]